MREKYDITIIGGGPGGYVAALRGAQLKKKVAVVEKDRIGGTCMNYGCIPTKYLLHQSQMYRETKENKNFQGPLDKIRINWASTQDEKKKIIDRLVSGIEFLLKRNKIEIIRGKAFLKDEKKVAVQTKEGERILVSEKIILATGSRPAHLPFLAPNGKEIVTSREALEFEAIPKTLLVVGAGAIGIEIGTLYQRLGTDVTILEIMPTILPGSEKEIVTRLEKILKRQGLKIYTDMEIEESAIQGGEVVIKGFCQKTQEAFEFEAEKVLLATGRRPDSDGLGNVDTKALFDEQGFIRINAQLETCIPGIYAIGDLIGGKLLAHKASHEGIMAAENASGSSKTMDYDSLPMAVFTEPEFASVGLTTQEAQERGIKIQVGMFSLQANGRALTMGKPEGMVKVLADRDDKIIGAHILSPMASELAAELSLAIRRGMTLQDISSSIHIHPTLSEAVMESTLKAQKQAIHSLNT